MNSPFKEPHPGDVLKKMRERENVDGEARHDRNLVTDGGRKS